MFWQSGELNFYIKGKHSWVKKCHELNSDSSLSSHYHVVPSPNAYMNYEVYLGLFPKLCKDIREIPVARDHKDWWSVWRLDRFGSDINAQISQKIFREHKIIISRRRATLLKSVKIIISVLRKLTSVIHIRIYIWFQKLLVCP